MNSNVLISTAMISSIWEKQNKDSLDLMLPFLKYAIAKDTKIGNVVNVDRVLNIFKREFGYDTIPYGVLVTMLNRLSPGVLTKKKDVYTLSNSLDKELEDFEKRRTLYKARRSQVGNTLANFLNEHISKTYECESALVALIEFFVNNGLVVAQTPEQLSLLRKDKDGKVNYYIARFLVDEHKRESEIFDYIAEMVKGFFVSTAISFQPENLSLPKAKFKNLHCYLDTRVILDALGLRLQSSQKAALELFEMLRAEQAILCCFDHTVAEIRDIIKAYRHGLSNPNGNTVHNTLERWDEQKYTVEKVSRYLTLLEKKIEGLGVEIVSSPKRKSPQVRGINKNRFINKLKQQVHYNTLNARENDISSVLGVMRLRAGKASPELEKCGHIFVTTNIPLISVVNDCIYDLEAGVAPVIADTAMSSIVWFKCSHSHKDYPTHKLLENAMLALEPTHALLKEFYTAIDQLQADGGVSEEEAAIIRTDIQIRRTVMTVVGGDESKVNTDLVKEMREKLRDRYVGESNEKIRENFQQYLEQKSKNDQALHQLISEIEDCGEQCKKRVDKILNAVVYSVLGGIFLLLIACTIAAFIVDDSYGIGAVVALVVEVLSLYDFVSEKGQNIRKYMVRISTRCADKAMDRKRREYSSVITTLTGTET